MPCSLTPASPPASRLGCDAAVRPSAQITASALATGLSGLYHTAWTLAVYASQPGLPHGHARLASGRWQGVAGQVAHLLGPIERFPLLARFLLPQA